MPGYFSIMIDKSTLQGLTSREAEWLFHHFRVNIPPVLFHEIIGDLTKIDAKRSSTGSGIGDVRMLATKITDTSIDLNAPYQRLVIAELNGHRIKMDGRPVLEHAERVRDPRGGYGLYVDATPMQRVMDRWRKGEFDAMEEEFGAQWREGIKSIDLETILRQAKRWRDKSISTPAQVSQLVDQYINVPDQNYLNLKTMLEIVQTPARASFQIVQSWKKAGRPAVHSFAPYLNYIARIETFFCLAVCHGVVSTRKSNVIDFDYFKYLPFTKVFSSGDNLHRDLFSVFAGPGQIFVGRDELKTALSEIADYYDKLDDDEKAQGSYTYADFPPVTLDNAVTRAYDQITPGWREGANRPEPPMTAQQEEKIMASIRPIIEAINGKPSKRNFTILGSRPLRSSEDPFSILSKTGK